MSMNPRENEKFNKLGFVPRSVKKKNITANSVKYILFPFFFLIEIRHSESISLNYEIVSFFGLCVLEYGSSDICMSASLLPASKYEILSKLIYNSIIIYSLQLFRVLFWYKKLYFLRIDFIFRVPDWLSWSSVCLTLNLQLCVWAPHWA